MQDMIKIEELKWSGPLVCTGEKVDEACCTKVEQDVYPDTNEPKQGRKEVGDIYSSEEKKLKLPNCYSLNLELNKSRLNLFPSKLEDERSRSYTFKQFHPDGGRRAPTPVLQVQHSRCTFYLRSSQFHHLIVSFVNPCTRNPTWS